MATVPAAPPPPAFAPAAVAPAPGAAAPEIRSRLFAVMLLGNKDTYERAPAAVPTPPAGMNTYKISGSSSLRNIAFTRAADPPPPPPPLPVPLAAPAAPFPPPAPAPISSHEENLRPLGFLQIWAVDVARIVPLSAALVNTCVSCDVCWNPNT